MRRGVAGGVVGLAGAALACAGAGIGPDLSGMEPLGIPVRAVEREGTGMFHNEGCMSDDVRFVGPSTIAARVVPVEGESPRIATWSVPELTPGPDVLAVPEYVRGSPWFLEDDGDVWGLWQGALRHFEAGSAVQEVAWPDLYPDRLVRLSETRFLAYRRLGRVEVADVGSGPVWRSAADVADASLSPDRSRIAAILDEGLARPVVLWDANDGHELARFQVTAGTPGAIAWSPDGGRLALGSWREGLQILDASDGRVLRGTDGPGPTRYVSAGDDVAWSQDGSRIYVISWGGAIAVHTGEGEQVGWLPAPSPDPDREPTDVPDGVTASYVGLELSPDGRWLVAWRKHDEAGAFDNFVCDAHVWILDG